MAGLLTWRDATAADRDELQHFTCTDDPVKRRHAPYGIWHPRQAEYDVQRLIRGRCRPPCHPPQYLIVGTDSEGIGAVARYEEEAGSPAEVFLQLMAVHRRLRRRGGGYADEMVEEVLDRLTTRAMETGTALVQVTGHVDETNHASQSLCRRSDFRHTGLLDEYQVWTLKLLTEPD